MSTNPNYLGEIKINTNLSICDSMSIENVDVIWFWESLQNDLTGICYNFTWWQTLIKAYDLNCTL